MIIFQKWFGLLAWYSRYNNLNYFPFRVIQVYSSQLTLPVPDRHLLTEVSENFVVFFRETLHNLYLIHSAHNLAVFKRCFFQNSSVYWFFETEIDRPHSIANRTWRTRNEACYGQFRQICLLARSPRIVFAVAAAGVAMEFVYHARLRAMCVFCERRDQRCVFFIFRALLIPTTRRTEKVVTKKVS